MSTSMLQVAPNGTVVFANPGNGHILIYSGGPPMKVTYAPGKPAYQITEMEISPDSSTLYIDGYHSSELIVIDIATAVETARFPGP